MEISGKIIKSCGSVTGSINAARAVKGSVDIAGTKTVVVYDNAPQNARMLTETVKTRLSEITSFTPISEFNGEG